MKEISGKTRLFAVYGTPIEHSLSPLIHNASFRHIGVDARYLAFDVKCENIESAISSMRTLFFGGVNLTMPLKKVVIPYLDSLTESAQLIGAVNTLYWKEGKLVGHNTDGAGMVRAIREENGEVTGKNVVVLGTGGASLAICAQLGLEKAAQVRVFKRNNSTFMQSQSDIRALSECVCVPMDVYDIDDSVLVRRYAYEADVVINATPVGMGKPDESPLPSDVFHLGQYVADAVYHPRMTRMLRDAQKSGAHIVEGVGMLLWQALLAEEVWLADELKNSEKSLDPSVIIPVLGLSNEPYRN
ncbi:MAG: shikimate dehydrogenase [Actinomycetaceae bacterium]|nr:shikimate dehydrogenase [Actinomycetaceae bacterium]